MATQYENIIVMGKSGAGKQPRIDVLIEIFGLTQLSTGNIFRTYLGLFDKMNFEVALEPFYDTDHDRFIADTAITEKLGISDQAGKNDILLGLKAKYYVNQGLFVPDEITDALFESAFRAMECRGAVLDGFPRTLKQARFLKALADEQDARLDAILLVENDDDTIIKRTVGRRICRNCGAVYHIEYNPPPEGGCGGDANKQCDIVQRSDDTIENLQARLREFHKKTEPAIGYLVAQGIPLYTVPGNLPEFTPEAVKASVLEAMQIA